jgi:putative ABC transport system permease protein
MRYLFLLIIRNAFRQKLRTALTIVGIIIATVAFGLLRTVVDAWYGKAESASAARLITRNAISLVFPLPLSYEKRIQQVKGVAAISHSNWFGGVYISEKNFFPQFAIEPRSYLSLYPEYLLSPQDKKDFLRDRQGAIAGSKLAKEYGWKIGDVIPIRGTIYPGNWKFILRGIYRGASEKIDETLFLFHWEYLNESLKKTGAKRADHVGVYIIGLENPNQAAEVSRAVDILFKNSPAETLTETEKVFQLGFVAMTEAIVTVIKVVSFVIIIIIMAIMANTMAMSARERKREYATLKALGFPGRFIALLIYGESVIIAMTGGLLGLFLLYPLADIFVSKIGTLFPVFKVTTETAWLAIGIALLVGLAAAVIPAWRGATVPIVSGFREIG